MEDIDPIYYVIALAALILWIVILNAIIKGCLAPHKEYLRMMFRLKALEMIKKGMPYEEFRELNSMGNEDFWIKLQEESPKTTNTGNEA